MKINEIRNLTNEELVASFYWSAVRSTKEVNSRRGISKATQLVELRLLDELALRFNLNRDTIEKELDK